VLCCDEKTGIQARERKYPTKPMQPGRAALQEFEYIRHGTRCLLATFVVPTGLVYGDVTAHRTRQDFCCHLRHTVAWLAVQYPQAKKYHWVLDNLNTHWSLEACEILAALNGRPFWPRALKTGRQRRAFVADGDYPYRFVFTPKHGSWLNQVELWFSVLARRFLRRGDFAGATEFEARLQRFLEEYNARHAHPYRWTYTGEPLVRATPFSQTRRQQVRGRAWSSPRPAPWERALYPPRPYRRAGQRLAANL
jgi:transposase